MERLKIMKRNLLFFLFAFWTTILANAVDWTNYMGIYVFNHVESKSIYTGNTRQVDFDSSKNRFQDSPECRIEIGADWVGVPNHVYKIVGRKVNDDGSVMMRLKDDAWMLTATLEILTDKNINLYLVDEGKIYSTTWYTKRYVFKPYEVFRGKIGNQSATLVSYPIENYSENKEISMYADFWTGDNISSVKSLTGEFSYGRDIHLIEKNANGKAIAEWFCMILQCDNTSNKICISGSMTKNGQTLSVDLKQKSLSPLCNAKNYWFGEFSTWSLYDEKCTESCNASVTIHLDDPTPWIGWNIQNTVSGAWIHNKYIIRDQTKNSDGNMEYYGYEENNKSNKVCVLIDERKKNRIAIHFILKNIYYMDFEGPIKLEE